METTTRTLSSSKVQVQLALCAAAATGLAVAPQAEAAIVTTFTNSVITVPQTTSGVYLNLLTGGTATAATTGWDFNPYSTTSGALGFYWPQVAGTAGGVTATSGGTTYANLTAGSVVSSASFFTSAILGTSANFNGTGTEILGFRFQNETTGAVNYGYMTIQTTATTGFPAVIRGWTFENTGAAITVVPEPSTVGFLAVAAGAVGVRAWRRRKAA